MKLLKTILFSLGTLCQIGLLLVFLERTTLSTEFWVGIAICLLVPITTNIAGKKLLEERKYQKLYGLFWIIYGLFWGGMFGYRAVPRQRSFSSDMIIDVPNTTGGNDCFYQDKPELQEAIKKISKELLDKNGLAIIDNEECGPYFVYKSDKNCKYYLDDIIHIGVNKKVSEKRIKEIFELENLRIEWAMDTTYAVETTTMSKFQESLSEAIYLEDKYDEIKFAEPNTIASYVGYQGAHSSSMPVNKCGFRWDGVIPTKEPKLIESITPRTLKDLFQYVATKIGRNDLEVIRYMMDYSDRNGKSTTITILLRSKSEGKYYRVSEDETGDEWLKIKEENDPTYDKEIGLSINKMKDTPEVIDEAVSKKKTCNDNMFSINYFGNSALGDGYVHVLCPASGWEASKIGVTVP